MSSAKTLVADFKSGEVRALSRLISAAENRDELALEVLKECFSKVGRARVLGITGPPGAGKSTLINFFVRFIREQKKRVAVIAVDPVSPFSGGALLGDRIRLADHYNDPGVFIRSLSTRGRLGGLSLATREAVHAADAFGFDYVLVETVGVGQSEVDIFRLADVTLLVLVPEWGDAIQTLKAGILEVADIFLVNKSDREGATRVISELKTMLEMAGRSEAPVLASTQTAEETVRSVFAEVDGFWAGHSKLVERRRAQMREATVLELIETEAVQRARRWAKEHVASAENPYEVVARMLNDKHFLLSE